MRHLVKGRKLGRTTSHRKATMRSLSVALIENERITTTLPKAKELRRHVEPVITRSKEDSTHNRREAFSFLRKKEAVTKLFEEIGPLVSDRNGGYTRIVKLGQRQGDGAEVAMIELVDYNDVQPTTPGKKKKTRRAGGSRRAGKKAGSKKETTAEADVENNETKATKSEAKPKAKTESKKAAPKKDDKPKTEEKKSTEE